MSKYSQYSRKGVAIIAVLLVIMTITVVALVSIKTAQNEATATSGFRYNRQATYAAHAVGNFVYTAFDSQNEDRAELYFAEVSQNESYMYEPAHIVESTGLSSGSTRASTRPLLGDLNKSFKQMGSIEDLAMVVGDTVGMSDATMFCRYNLTMVGVAIAGRSPRPGEGNTFTMHALDTRAASRKYELGYALLQPAPCQ